jgi:hypothetical protein
MINTDFWDEYEYNFFINLKDDDKLLYIYDLMIGDFQSEYFDGDNFDYEFESDDELTNVAVLSDTHDVLSITGANEDALNKVATNIMMNGMLLTNGVATMGDMGVILLSFNVLGRGVPISLN